MAELPALQVVQVSQITALKAANGPETDNNQTELLPENMGTRYYEDQPDVNDDFQIHFIYMLDKDAKDNQWDINGRPMEYH